MIFSFVLGIVVSLICQPSVVAGHKSPVHVVLDAGAGSNWSQIWSPTFVSLLNEKIGNELNVSFELSRYVSSQRTMDQLVSDGLVDFYFCQPPSCACAQARYDASPILTIRRFLPGNEKISSVFGGVIIARANNSKIKSIMDLKGATIGVENAGAWGTALLEMEALLRSGVHMYRDARVIAVGSLTQPFTQQSILDLVLSGILDAGFVRSDFLISSAQANLINVLERVPNGSSTFSYPLPSSTDLSPDWGILAFPHVDTVIKVGVLSVLLQIDSKSPPAVKGGYFGWAPALSYDKVRDVLDEFGLIKHDRFGNSGRDQQCIWNSPSFDYYDLVTCLSGHYKVIEARALQNCLRLNVSCSAPICWCSPCVLGSEIRVFLSSPSSAKFLVSPEAPLALCNKLEVCATVEQAQSFCIFVEDNLSRLGVNFSFRLWDPRLAAASHSEGGLVVSPGSPWNHSASLSLKHTGVYLIELSENGVPLDSSPFFIEVQSAACRGAFRQADAEGRCVCGMDSVEITGSCLATSTIYYSVLIPTFFLVFVGACVSSIRRIEALDGAWKIRFTDLVFDDPPLAFGRGSHGIIFRAEYRGTKVAVKRIKYSDSMFAPKTNQAINLFHRSTKHFKTRTKKRASKVCMDHHSERVGVFEPANPTSLSQEISEMYDPPKLANVQDCNVLCWIFQNPHETLMYREMRALSKLRHPNIATLMGIIRRTDALLVMEFMEQGSLYDLLHNQTIEFEGDFVLSILKDIVQGMRFLHAGTPPIIHGDLKTDNILVDGSKRAKIKYLGQRLIYAADLVSSSPAFMSPELIQTGVRTKASDVYAFGVLLHEICSRSDPYEGEDTDAVLVAVVTDNRRPAVSPEWPKLLSLLMTSCWEPNPADRMSFEDIDVALRREGGSLLYTLHSDLERTRGTLRRAVDVLQDMFPAHVASALADGRPVEPMQRDNVTIYFSDIVGYTTISSELDAGRVADLLNRLYRVFDMISEELGVFKVETIGDAYLATTNLLSDQSLDHVAIMARFALRCMEAAGNTPIDESDPSRGCVSLRAGFHSGPVVANVVGSKYKKFCLIGDSVNIASRMESTSMPNRIQCSEASAKFLRRQAPAMLLEDRGNIEVKGKGTMRTFFLNGESDSPQTLSVAAGLNVPQSMRNLFSERGGAARHAFESSPTLSRVPARVAGGSGLGGASCEMDLCASERRLRSGSIC